uniref:DNA topoisomerase 2-binding protein 1-like isoform X2 n=1 Tax=Ciona intestinalis TaxID=7719 RepID=UPI000EF4BB3C|nr:DNA topoisomerase 2-binding protein 1-like isoform X2 [Ciona intestinalis]|eukprot:XP_026696149.1 DNA topoisomerase 2-binding protein 1-like isoform X2 [Ciona intestinalis]
MKQRKEKLVETPLREKILRLNLATPSKFMTKGVDPNVSFDLDDVFEYLRTPDQTRMEMKQAMRDKPDTPLSVFVERFLAESLKGIDDSSNIVANLEKVFDKEEVNYDITGGEESIKSKEILRGVVVYVSKKLSDQRLKLNELVKQLGGEVRLGYDGSCTHFVFQGKNNDPNREFRLARSDGKFIVSPHWVAACEDGRVGEGEFPHDYDPNRSIQIVRKPSLSSNIEKPEGDNVDSQEVRESLRRTLENIMSGKPSVARTQRLSNTVFTPEATRDKTSDEMSQDVQVVWDDPIGREEMERLQCLQTMVNPPKEEAQNINEGKPPMFLISSVAPDKKVEYAAIIQDLGGKYLDRDYFDPECTHLIVQKPARNEKYLASLSAGKWVLHTSYIEACKKASTFVKEEEYEYGNPSFEWSPSNEIESLLGASAIRWRQLLGSSGAFSGWKVILHLNDRQSPGFVRLLQSGSASVVATSLPYSGPLEGITHAILDQNKIKQIPSTDVENLVRAGVHCCLPEYIAEYLMKDPQPKPEDLYLPLVKTMLFESGNTDSGTPKKRRRFN